MKLSLKERIIGINRLLLITVIIPTTLAIIYFGLIASDIYISESRFVVRSPQKQQSINGLGSLLQSAGFSRSQDDTFSVHDFITSRDALNKLNNALDTYKAFGDSHIDFFARFNSLSLDGSFEALYKYYQKMLAVEFDTASSISILTVRAYSAEDAWRINNLLLTMSETLVNQLNERARQDMIQFATNEVAIAEKKVKAAGSAMSAYRKKNDVFDPNRQTTLQFQHISKLQDSLISNKTQLAEVSTFTPDNPQIPTLKKRIETLSAEIETEKNKITGSGKSFTDKTAQFERLTLDLNFADKQLTSALASLELARNDAVRKQLYLERIVQPNKPDVGIEPRRMRAIFTTFLVGLILMGVLNILIAGVREHKD